MGIQTHTQRMPSKQDEGKPVCLFETCFVLATDPTVGEDYAKLRVSRLLHGFISLEAPASLMF